MDKLYPDSTITSSNEQANSCSITDSANFTAQIIHFLDRPIAFHRCFASITGSITAALMLSQALYWQKRCKHPEGWWYKTRDDWYEETGMGRREQEGARRKLRQLQVLQEKRCGVPAQLWYRVNEPRLLNLLMDSNKNDDLAPAGRRKTRHPVGTKPPVQLVQNRPTGWAETAQQAGSEPPSKLAQFQPTIPFNTETTTETLSETTTTTTTTTLARNKPALHDGNGCSSGCSQRELIFDFHLAGLSLQEKERTTELLEGLDSTTAQQVLDEFNEALGSSTIKKSRWGWLRQVAQTAREGTFQLTADLSERRRKQQQAIATQPPARKPSQTWEHHRKELLEDGITSADYGLYIAPLRGQEDGHTLWLEAPNPIVMTWVRARLPLIERHLRPHTPLPIRICIG